MQTKLWSRFLKLTVLTFITTIGLFGCNNGSTIINTPGAQLPIIIVGNSGTIINSTAGLGSTWNVQPTQAGGANLFAVTKGNLYVIVGAGGVILSSPDGLSWTSQNSGTKNDLNWIGYGKGTYVAVGSNGTILTSIDAITWVTQNSGSTSNLVDSEFLNSMFFTVGSGGTILTSSDAVNWTPQITGTTTDLSAVIYANNGANSQFVTVGNNIGNNPLNNAIILTSPNSVNNWAPQNSGTLQPLIANQFGKNIYVAVGTAGTILNSTNAVTWKPSNSITTNTLNDLEFKNGSFLAVGNNGTIIVSNNGINWSNILSTATVNLNSAAFP